MTTEVLSVEGVVLWAGVRWAGANRLRSIAGYRRRSPTLGQLCDRIGCPCPPGAAATPWDRITRTVCTPDAVLCEVYDVSESGEIIGHVRVGDATGGYFDDGS